MSEMAPRSQDSIIRRHPITSYFSFTYAISWAGAFAIAVPYLVRGKAVPLIPGLMMFPVMLLGPSIAGIAMTWVSQGTQGLRMLCRRMRRLGSTRWIATFLIPPGLVFAVSFALKTFVSSRFAPNLFPMGVVFGTMAGFFEEIGWTGFAFPTMRLNQKPCRAAVSLGLLWAAWHIPVIDHLGSAVPHGQYWIPFFLSFTAAMTAMRVLTCWVYANTESVLLAQMLHASSTGALAVFSPAHVTAGQEAFWYAMYAVLLWAAVVIVVANYGTALVKAA